MVDSALTGYAMYFDLQDSRNARELGLWKLRQHLPPALFDLLAHDGSQWDAPLSGAARGNALLPGADQVDLRRLPMPDSARPARLADKGTPGSNNWAVAGTLTADGRAIVADDMHLGLRAPGIWFRVRLRYPDARAPGGRVDVAGFSLPGLPAVVAGSNGHVAWGFTNSYIDTADWLRYPAASLHGEGDAGAFAGEQAHAEVLHVAGADPVRLEVRETRWGPILHRLPDGSALALRWTAHLPGAVGIGLADMARANDIEQALAVASRAGMPAQNLVVVDAAGRIALQLTGMRPARPADCPYDAGMRPVPPPPGPAPAPAAGQIGTPYSCPWGIRADGAPQLVAPASGRLWTANARVLDGKAWPSPATVAMPSARGRARSATTCSPGNASPKRTCSRSSSTTAPCSCSAGGSCCRTKRSGNRRLRLCAPWPKPVRAGTAALRWTRSATGWCGPWRLAVHARIADGLTAPAQAALGDAFAMPDFPQLEGVALPLLEQRPRHLLPRRYGSWEALLEDAATEVRDDLAAKGPLSARSWGERNTAKICHPLATALPDFLKGQLCMPAEPLPGDGAMPRVQGPAFGASERMVVSPGHEADAIVHARRPEWPPAVAVLACRTRRLGTRTGHAVPAGTGDAHPDPAPRVPALTRRRHRRRTWRTINPVQRRSQRCMHAPPFFPHSLPPSCCCRPAPRCSRTLVRPATTAASPGPARPIRSRGRWASRPSRKRCAACGTKAAPA